MSENKEKVSSKEVGLEIGLVISRFLYKTEHLHYGYWPDDLAIIPENVGKAQDLHSKLIMDTIPEDVETILDIGSGSGGLAEKLIDKYKDQLAMSLATVVNIIDPDVFVFGGGVSNEIDFLDEIKQKMKKFVAGGEFEGTFLKPKFGDASGVRGAARLARTTNY